MSGKETNMQVSTPDNSHDCFIICGSTSEPDCSITNHSQRSERTSFTPSKTLPWEQSPERGKTFFLIWHN